MNDINLESAEAAAKQALEGLNDGDSSGGDVLPGNTGDLPGGDENGQQAEGGDDPHDQELDIDAANEVIARKSGWKPKEEWEESKGEWLPADEFNRRGPLFETISTLKKDVKEYKKSIDALTEHNRMMEDKTREKVLKELEEEKIQAVEDGDVDRYKEIEQEIDEYKPAVEPGNTGGDDGLDPSIKAWVEKNSWYNTEPAMQAYMLQVQQENLDKGMSISEALTASEQSVKREFSHKFENPNRNKPGQVLSGNEAPSKKTYSITDLPAEYRPVYQAIARKTDMKLPEYIKQLKEAGAM